MKKIKYTQSKFYAFLKQNNLTVAQAAKVAGVSANTIRNLITGSTGITETTADRIAAGLGTPISSVYALFGKTGPTAKTRGVRGTVKQYGNYAQAGYNSPFADVQPRTSYTMQFSPKTIGSIVADLIANPSRYTNAQLVING